MAFLHIIVDFLHVFRVFVTLYAQKCTFLILSVRAVSFSPVLFHLPGSNFCHAAVWPVLPVPEMQICCILAALSNVLALRDPLPGFFPECLNIQCRKFIGAGSGTGVQLCGCAFDEVRRDCHTLGRVWQFFTLREIALQ